MQSEMRKKIAIVLLSMCFRGLHLEKYDRLEITFFNSCKNFFFIFSLDLNFKKNNILYKVEIISRYINKII